MKYCAFFLREKFTKTFFVFVFVLLGSFSFSFAQNSTPLLLTTDGVNITNTSKIKLGKTVDTYNEIVPAGIQGGTKIQTQSIERPAVKLETQNIKFVAVSGDLNNPDNVSTKIVDGYSWNVKDANGNVFSAYFSDNGTPNLFTDDRLQRVVSHASGNIYYSNGGIPKDNFSEKAIINKIATDEGFKTPSKSNPNQTMYDRMVVVDKIGNAQMEAQDVATGNQQSGINDAEDQRKLEAAINKKNSGQPISAEEQTLINRAVSGGGYKQNPNGQIVTAGAATRAEKAAAEENREPGVCFDVSLTGVDLDIANCIEQGLYYLMYVLSLILAFVGMIFNWVIDFTIIKMSGYVKELSIINAAWEVFRDLANILFIFLLLYLSIQTILQTDGGEVKHTLSKLIIVALLLNFSLFFTKVIIDSSNILTITIYEKIKPSDGPLGLADAFMSVFQFQKLYDQKGMEAFNNSGNIDLGEASRQFAGQQYDNAWTTFIMGSIMIIIATFVFTSVIIIFLKRFVVLILLMVTAPIAFVASIFPKTSGMAEEMWWGNLIKNAFYAPLFMVFIWISLKILTATDFIKTVKSGEPAIIPIIAGFIVAIAFLIASLVAAESLHVAGAHTAMKWYGGMQGWLGKNTVGRAVYNLLEKGDTSHFLYNTAAEGLRSSRLDKLKKIPVVGSWAGDLYNAGTKKAAQVGFDLAHHTASSDFSSIPFMGGGHGDHGGGDHKAGGYAKKVQDEADKQKAWWSEQKGNPEAWSEVFEKVDANGKTHEGKVLERVSEQWEDKVELVQSIRFRIDDLQEKYNNEKDPGKKAKIKERLDRVKDWNAHLMGGSYTDTKREPAEGRFTAKEQDRVNRGLEGATINHRTRFDKLSKEIGDGTGPDAEKNIKRTRDFYRTLNPKQKVGLRVDQYTNPHVVDLNIDSNVFEQAQREAKMTPETTDIFGKIGFSAESRDKAYKAYEEARKTNDSTKIQEAEKELFDKFKYLGAYYESQLQKINSETDSVKREGLKTELIETYRDTRSKGEAKLGKYFEQNGGRWYDRPAEFLEKPKTPNITQQATAQTQNPPNTGHFFG